MSDSAEPTPKKERYAAWREPFLATLRNTGNVRASALAAQVDRHRVYQARANSAEFRAQWDTALEDACDLLEAAARKRALEISDTLLIFLLKAHRPAVYRERINIHVEIRREAERIAAERNLPLDAVIAEAEAMLTARQG